MKVKDAIVKIKAWEELRSYIDEEIEKNTDDIPLDILEGVKFKMDSLLNKNEILFTLDYLLHQDAITIPHRNLNIVNNPMIYRGLIKQVDEDLAERRLVSDVLDLVSSPKDLILNLEGDNNEN